MPGLNLYFFKLFPLIISILGPLGLAAQIEVSALADEYLIKLTELEQFNGVVLLESEGQTVLYKAYNFESDTASTLFVKEESCFDLRSVAKLFAKVAIIQLEDQEMLDRNDTIGTFFPGFPNGGNITLQHLLDHESGLPREFGRDTTINLSEAEIVDLASKAELEFYPGTESRYSNVGFQLVYATIGRAAGTSFSEFLRSAIFGPLAMENTGSNFAGALPDCYAFGHYRNAEDSIIRVNGFLPDEVQMGNLHSTVSDLALFLRSLDPEKYAELISEGEIQHAGGTRGKRAFVLRNYLQDYRNIFLATYDEIPFENLVADLKAMMEGKPVEMPTKVSRNSIHLDPSILEAFTGRYDLVDAGHILLEIRLKNDSLHVYQKGQDKDILYPETERIFFADPGSKESIEFIPNEEGTYDMLIDFQGVQWKGLRMEDSGAE
jgi:hypothetical protein